MNPVVGMDVAKGECEAQAFLAINVGLDTAVSCSKGAW